MVDIPYSIGTSFELQGKVNLVKYYVVLLRRLVLCRIWPRLLNRRFYFAGGASHGTAASPARFQCYSEQTSHYGIDHVDETLVA